MKGEAAHLADQDVEIAVKESVPENPFAFPDGAYEN
jgi:hypothetical protein